MTETQRGELKGRTVVLFDGECVLCHRTVRFLLRSDVRREMRFIPAETGLGRELLDRFAVTDRPNGVVLIEHCLQAGERMATGSDAALEALRSLGGAWGVVAAALVAVPRQWRERLYGMVAATRYRVWGRLASCPMPTAGERSRILGM